jgi:formylmethanofuran dehydrogenase subunit E
MPGRSFGVLTEIMKPTIDTGPPGKEEPSTRPSNRGHEEIKLRRYYLPRKLFATRLYILLLAERRTQDLLEPFNCACCGELALDPIGWNGRGQPLCVSCADLNAGKDKHAGGEQNAPELEERALAA